MGGVEKSRLENYSSWPITRPIQGGILNGSNKGFFVARSNSIPGIVAVDGRTRERERERRGSCVS